MTEPSKAALLRVWPHGDEMVARVTLSAGGDQPPEVVLLSGRESIVAWVDDWLAYTSGDAHVT